MVSQPLKALAKTAMLGSGLLGLVMMWSKAPTGVLAVDGWGIVVGRGVEAATERVKSVKTQNVCPRDVAGFGGRQGRDARTDRVISEHFVNDRPGRLADGIHRPGIAGVTPVVGDGATREARLFGGNDSCAALMSRMIQLMLVVASDALPVKNDSGALPLVYVAQMIVRSSW